MAVMTIEAQKQLTKEFLTKKITKAQLARDYKVSPRTVGRYIEKFEEQIKAELEAAKAEPVQPELEMSGLTKNQQAILNSYYKQKMSVPQKVVNRTGMVGRAKKGVKTIRFITMEILENLQQQGKLETTKPEEIIKQISTEAMVTTKVAKQYYSGHKVYFYKK